MKSKEENIRVISKIPIEECGEKLVLANKYNKKIEFVQMAKIKPSSRRVRDRIAQMLASAQELLPSRYRLGLTAGLRTKKNNEWLAEAKAKQLKKGKTEKEIKKEEKDILYSDLKTPYPHETGGAVDVVLLSKVGNQLEMDGKKKNLFFKAMIKAGFSNYPLEWWHWDYGDSAWAYRTGKKPAIYGRIAA